MRLLYGSAVGWDAKSSAIFLWKVGRICWGGLVTISPLPFKYKQQTRLSRAN